jgi:dienelactone hydrolase
LILAAIYLASALGGCAHLHGHVVDPAPLMSFSRSNRLIDGRKIEIYSRGHGPAVLLLHEIPALTPECLRLGGYIADRGFTVHVPLLFGRPPSAGRTSGLRGLLGACLFDRFSCFSTASSGRVVQDMRTLSAQLHREHPEQRMGVVGLCITGAIPLTLATDPWVGAVVLGQPALPFAIRNATKAAIAAAPGDIAEVKKRHVPVLALRFSQDAISPCARLDSLCTQFGPQMQVLEVASGTDDSDIPKSAHAVLTAELGPETQPQHPTRVALQQTLAFLVENLQGPGSPPSWPGGSSCRWTVLGARNSQSAGSLHCPGP